ncbi:hypothetical protein JQ615_33580 [Bradyrhizobium jicamae]|uniref:Uncharacterized protein n=1 Tax=Bradyrhizobium jicamae TaxID=280332 RepID=A0ABS5FVK1_9BRAD|nr:hypothetical protein [Bradyrhizobium jicamae]MBR0800311.1 hypothetical protein [Bradyrhizobium jicamae]
MSLDATAAFLGDTMMRLQARTIPVTTASVIVPVPTKPILMTFILQALSGSADSHTTGLIDRANILFYCLFQLLSHVCV